MNVLENAWDLPHGISYVNPYQCLGSHAIYTPTQTFRGQSWLLFAPVTNLSIACRTYQMCILYTF